MRRTPTIWTELTIQLVVATCVLFVFAVDPSWSQVRTGMNSVKGVVTDANSGSPLSSVNIFLRGTTVGTVSRIDGKFELFNLPDGEFEIVFSLVGYIRMMRHISLKDSLQMELKVTLIPKEIGTTPVEVTASAEEWRNLLPIFTREFLGATGNAKDCKILNPEVLNLSIGSTGDSLKAFTDSTLIVDNNALGYRIYAQIDSFLVVSYASWFIMRCYARFEEMKPENENQSRQWDEKRAKCHKFSFRHFLECTAHRYPRDAGFLVTVGDLRELHRGKGDELEPENFRLRADRDSTRFQIDFSSDQLRVDRLDHYDSWKAPLKVLTSLHDPAKTDMRILSSRQRDEQALKEWKDQFQSGSNAREDEEMTSSIISIRQRPIVADKFGNLVKPYSVAFRGFWATRRLADTLPFDYLPPESTE
jgi:hypothetical protein